MAMEHYFTHILTYYFHKSHIKVDILLAFNMLVYKITFLKIGRLVFDLHRMSLQDTSFLLFDHVLLHFGPEIHTFCGILTFWIKGIPVLLKRFEHIFLYYNNFRKGQSFPDQASSCLSLFVAPQLLSMLGCVCMLMFCQSEA